VRFKIRAPNADVYRQVLTLLGKYHTEPKIASERRGLVSVDDLSPRAIAELESLRALVTEDPQYSLER
jgi:hypothetical protein